MTPLEWGGRVAERLGLVGEVTIEQYRAAIGPGGFVDPLTGERLVATKTPGFEIVVAAHKATALLGVVGRADDMHAILDVETAATIGILEGWMRENGGRRGRSATPTETEGLVYAVTRHGTSRAGDPSPHDHILVGNVTYMLDAKGGYKALFSALFRDRVEAATMHGRLASAWEAVQLGYPIELDNGPVRQVAALAHRRHPAGSLRRVVEALRSDRRVPVREGLRRLPGGARRRSRYP